MPLSHIDLRETHHIGKRTRERLVGASSDRQIVIAGLRLVGMSWANVGFEFVRRRPDVAQVLACTSGEGRVLVDGEWQSCRAGQVYVTPVGETHAYRAVRSWHVCWLMWSAERAFEEFDAWPKPRVAEADVEPLASAINGLLCAAGSPGDSATQRVWLQLVLHYARQILAPTTIDIRLVRLWRHASADLSRAWTMREMARIAEMSTEHLRRLCLRAHGVSPMRHLLQLRMKRASELLVANDLKIEAIARQVGYQNAFAFSTAFRRTVGHRPSDLRLK